MDIDEREHIKSLLKPSQLLKSDNSKYEKMLLITIPKFVISDSRPKAGKGDSFYNINKIMLMEIFKIIYDNDDLLKNLTLFGKYFIVLKAFIRPSIKVEKVFGEELIASEEIECVAIKDNDNIEKVHWDVLQDEKYHILLDDSFVSCNMTLKYWSYNPRVEIIIYHDPTEYKEEYLKLMYDLEKYKKFLCTKKRFTSPKEFWENLFKTKLKNKKGSNNKLIAILKNYTVNELDEIISYIEPDNPILKTKLRNKKLNEIYLIYLKTKNQKGVLK